jgi:hypothetical protein
MLMAAGVALALLGGSVALSFSLSGNQTAEAGARKASKPIVRTIHRTIRVEKQAKGSDRTVRVVTLQAPTSSSDQPSTSSGSYEHEDDAYEHDDDDSYEHHDGDSYEHGDDD